MKDHRGISAETLTEELWNGFFSGGCSTTSFAALRQGILTGWKASAAGEGGGRRQTSRGHRRGLAGWQAGLPRKGLWFPLTSPPEPDPLEQEELRRERIRILLERYGLLTRPLMARELPEWEWSGLLPSLRLMELSGEILGGYFFKGLPGPQFLSQEALRLLQRGIPPRIRWMNALDPASPCGLGIEKWEGMLPKRLVSNHLVFDGTRLVLVSRKNGKDLTFYAAPDEEGLKEYLSFFKILIRRDFQPLKRIEVKQINEEPALESPYHGILEQMGFLKGLKGYLLTCGESAAAGGGRAGPAFTSPPDPPRPNKKAPPWGLF